MTSAYQTVSRVANETYGHARRIMPPQPWWDNLESSFHKFPDDFELDLPTQILVDGTAGIDLAVRTAVASLVSVLALPLSANPLRLMQDLEDGMDIDTAPVDKELGAFEDVIDNARETADELADKYASVSSAQS